MEPFVGEIRMFTFDWAPQGFALCNGAMLPAAQNQALLALIGNQYGGDGKTNFAVPDLRGRVPLAMGRQPNEYTNYQQGQTGGTETVALTATQVPPHSHSLNASPDPGDSIPPGSVATTTVPAVARVLSQVAASGTNPTINIYTSKITPLQPLDKSVISAAGSNTPHNNMQPFAVTNFCIATIGIWPPMDN